MCGDGVKESVLGSGSLNVPSLPKLRDVFLVDELNTNLISIIQLHNQDLFVKFKKDKCIVINQNQFHIMEGNRSLDNCYLLASPNTCLNVVQNNYSLWHIRLGHISHNNLRDTIVVKVIRGVPNLKVEPERMSVPCQLGKLVRTSHIEFQLGSTIKVLELVHIDLMEPMQVESIVGKMYVYVCVNDFFKFT